MSKRVDDPGYAAGWCIHYRYNRRSKSTDQNLCEAGVDLDKFHAAKFVQRPCFLDEQGQSKPYAIVCDQLRRPTPDEIAEHEKWINRRMSILGTVMKGILPWRQAHKGTSAQEIVKCPACGGNLNLSISSYNGHVHGNCETTGCVSWME